MTQTNVNFESVFESMPGNSVLLDIDFPTFTILAATADYQKLTGKTFYELKGKGIFEAFPIGPDDPQMASKQAMTEALQTIINTGKPVTLPEHRYDLMDADGNYEEFYWRAHNKAVFDSDGKVIYIIHSAEDVTSQIKSRNQENQIRGLQQANSLLMQAPVAISIVKGPDLLIDLANEPIIHLWGKGNDVIGKPLAKVLPELESQGFIDLIYDVLKTGNPHYAYENPLDLVRNGKKETFYFTFIYQPYYEEHDEVPTGVMIFANNVTQRVLALKKINEKELQYQNQLLFKKALLEAHNSASLDGILIVDAQGKILSCNKRFIEIWNMPQEITDSKDDNAALDFAKKQLVNPEEFLDGVKKCYATPGSVRIDELKFKDGRIIERQGIPILSENGHYYAWSWNFRDVTSQRNYENAIRESEYRFKTLIEEATVATALYHGESIELQYANEIMLAYWGKDSSVIGKTFEEALPEMFNQPFPALLKEVYRTGKPYIGHKEMASLMINGKLQPSYFNFTFKPLRNEKGEIYGIHHMAIDVTSEVLLTKSLEESSLKFQNLAASLEEKVRERTQTLQHLNETFHYAEQIGNFGSYRYTFHTGKLIYSDNLYRLLGCEPNEFEAGPDEFIKFIHPDDYDYVEAATKNAFEKREVSKWEYRVIRKDGKLIYVRGTGKLVEYPNGETYLIGTLQDITDEKKQEFQLKENNDALISMNKELESFAYISSHDLQEPLRKIQTYSSRIIEEEFNFMQESGQAHFRKIQSAAMRMQMLIDDLLVYSRTNTEDRNYEKINLVDIVDEIREELAEDLIIYQAEIITGKKFEAKVIQFQFRQLMHNLIGNALKFSKSTVRPRIVISMERKTGSELMQTSIDGSKLYNHIRISDNGIGFEPEYGTRIFEVFQRLHTRDKYSGTGIGLAIVKKIVENHHGLITATGKLNEGATFDIYFPVS